MVEYLMNGFPVIDVIFIIILLVWAKHLNVFSFVVFFFTYSLFHYGYTLPAVLSENTMLLGEFHRTSSMMALTSLTIFFCVWIFFVVTAYKERFFNPSFKQKYFMGAIVFISCVFIAPYILHPNLVTDTISLKSDFSVLLMLFFAYLFFVIIQDSNGLSYEKSLIILITCSFLSLLVASYEVFHGFSWAMSLISGNQILSRASSTMMNPNVYGLWSAILIIFSFYLVDKTQGNKVTHYIIFIIGVLGLYSTGSRSSLLFAVGLLKWFIGSRIWSAFKSFMMMFFVFYSICIFGLLSSSLKPLSDRFLELPVSIVYLVAGQNVNVNFMTSVWGRLGISPSEVSPTEVSPYYDNAYLAIMENSVAALGVWSAFAFLLLVIGLRKFYRRKDLDGVYAFISFLAFVVMGVFIRAYQIFPVFGECAFLLAIYIAWLVQGESSVYQVEARTI